MGAVARFRQLRSAACLALSPTYSKNCFVVYVLFIAVFIEACYLIKATMDTGKAIGVALPFSGETGKATADNAGPISAISLPHAASKQVVTCVKCGSPLPPSPWLVMREPPSFGRHSSNATMADRSAAVLWDYSELLISAQGASKCAHTSLVVAVRTEAHRRAQRSAIRRTWGHHGNYANCSFGLVFFMGAVSTNRVVRPVRAEFQLHKDIVVELKGRREPRETCTFALAVEPSSQCWTGSSYRRATCFGRVTLDSTALPHLEDCAVFAKPSALRRLQPAFADEALSCDAEVALVTGTMSRKAQLNVVHVNNMEPCNREGGYSVADSPAVVVGGGDAQSRPFTRTCVSIREMERLYLQDVSYYHNVSSLV
ncbi:hypothetical protein MRX96_038335 [Rhipicephalus microplus]